MDINYDKVKAFTAVTFIQLICGLIIPGYMFLFLYVRDLFLSLDLFRMTAIAVSITAPILTINSFITLLGLMSATKAPSREDIFHKIHTSTIYLGSILTVLVIYSSIIIGYYFKLNLMQGITIIIIAELIIIIAIIILRKYDSKINKSNK